MVEVADGKMAPSTLSAISAAAKCGPVTALVAGAGFEGAAKAVAACANVASVIYVNDAAYTNGLAENWGTLVASTVKAGGFTHVLAATSAFGKNVVPRVAAKFDAMPIVEVTSIVSEDTFVRATYAANAINTMKSKDAVKFLTVRAGNFDRTAASGGAAAVVSGAASPASPSSKWIEDQVARSDKPALESARVVVSGGRGLKSGENFAMLEKLAANFQGAVGATRAVVDAQWVPFDWQVGITGKTVMPDLYVAVGLSGAIQHVAGMKDSKVIVAINTDAEAPIFQVADYGLVEDCFTAVPKLTELTKKK